MIIPEFKPIFVIADDDQDDHLLLLQAFKDNEIDFEATSVYSGNQLMDYLLSRNSYQDIFHNKPDFILLDLNMPRKNGFDVLKEIKGNLALRNIPIFILSTSSNPMDQLLAIELGATKYFTKPQEYDDIRSMITEIIKLNFVA